MCRALARPINGLATILLTVHMFFFIYVVQTTLNKAFSNNTVPCRSDQALIEAAGHSPLRPRLPKSKG